MTRRATRTCQACEARLARDRVSDHCGPCTRRLISPVARPQPDVFWEARGIRDALAARHFGRFLAAYRGELRPRVSQACLGRWLGLTQAQVSRLEALTARAPGDLHKLQRWAKALHVPRSLLWFDISHTSEESARPATGINVEDVRRRQFLKTAGVTVIGTSVRTTTPTSTQPPEPAQSDAEFVRRMTETFRQLDNRFGGGHHLGNTSITGYLNATVTPMLNHTDGNTPARRELFAAAAELHQVAGWIAYDVGDPTRGRGHLRAALMLSQDAGDDALEAEMLAAMSHHAAFNRRDPDTAVDMALAARRPATRSGLIALRAEAAVLEAHGQALKGDTTACYAALHKAERVFERFVPGCGPTWLDYFDHAYLAAKFAHTFRDLGHPTEAERFARHSLNMSEGYERGRLFNTALLASILADQGRIEEACAEATKAVLLSGHVRSVRGCAYLTDVAQRLRPHSTNRGVRALYARMREAGVSAPA